MREVSGGGWTIDHAAVHRIAGRRLAVIGFGGIGKVVEQALALVLMSASSQSSSAPFEEPVRVGVFVRGGREVG